MTTEPVKLRVVRTDFEARSEELADKLERDLLPDMLETYAMLNDAINASNKRMASAKKWLKDYLRDHPSAEPFLEGKGVLTLKDGATRWKWDVASMAEQAPELLLQLAKAGCFNESPINMDTLRDLSGKGIVPSLLHQRSGEATYCWQGQNEPSLAWEAK